MAAPPLSESLNTPMTTKLVVFLSAKVRKMCGEFTYLYVFQVREFLRDSFLRRDTLAMHMYSAIRGTAWCLSVYHKPVSHRNGWMDRNSFRHSDYPLLRCTLHCIAFCKGFLDISKDEGIFLWSLVQKSELSRFFCFFGATRRPSQVLST